MDPLPSSLATTDLPLTAILIGVVLAGSHLVGLLAPDACIAWARTVPRSRTWGTVLLSLAVAWAAVIAATTDLGEFSPMRTTVVGAIIIGGFLLWKFVPDFLSSRSLGLLLLLAAHPVLETTFLQNGLLKLALAVLAYAWALAGLFLVGMPYLHRDLITWISSRRAIWTLLCWTGLLFGMLLLLDGVRMMFLE